MSTSASSVQEDETTAKTKLRKGTTSCRECKRRKTRCFFSSSTDPICVGCQRRGTTCRSQELGDEIVGLDDELSMRGRLIKVEALLGKLMEKVMPESLDTQSSMRGTAPAEKAQIVLPYPPSSSDCRENVSIQEVDARKSSTQKTEDKYEQIRQTLHAALPSQQDANLLLGALRPSMYLQTLCNPYSFIFQGDIQPPSTFATLPDETSHPVLLARKLLQLAICISHIEPSFDNSGFHFTESLGDVMTKYVDLASSLVTTNEKLIDSLEGLECLVLEALYLINCGNLRQAWLGARRAMSLAQFMGLHRGTPRALKILDPQTRASCPVIWSRIVYAERYLSLLLNVPSGISDNSFASEDNMIGATSTERLDKVHAVISGLIMARNEAGAYNEYTATQKIDFDLQRAANSVPAKWWLPPDLDVGMPVSELITDVIRAQTQIIHYNLLTILHLPYMLRNTSEARYDYSKATCINASREALSRYIAFRAIVRVVYCCRLVDFCAFTASLTLLLAHIGSHRNTSGDHLAHERLGNRALVEKVMDTMDELNQVNGDALSKKTAEVTRELLAIESNAADASCAYSARTMSEAEAEADDEDHGHSFRLKIPYFGTISISLGGLHHAASVSDSPGTFTPSSSSQPSAMGIPDSTYQVAPTMNQNWQLPIQQQQQQQQFGGDDQMVGQTYPLVSFQEASQSQQIDMPDFMVSGDEWPHQGVDATFFDALLRGDAANQVTWDDNWSNWDILR